MMVLLWACRVYLESTWRIEHPTIPCSRPSYTWIFNLFCGIYKLITCKVYAIDKGSLQCWEVFDLLAYIHFFNGYTINYFQNLHKSVAVFHCSTYSLLNVLIRFPCQQFLGGYSGALVWKLRKSVISEDVGGERRSVRGGMPKGRSEWVAEMYKRRAQCYSAAHSDLFTLFLFLRQKHFWEREHNRI